MMIFSESKSRTRASREFAEPKVVLVGGSNLIFGIDTPTMENILGQPVLNIGSGINAGLRYLLAYAESHVKPGDTVVLALEWELLVSDTIKGEAFVGRALDNPASTRLFSFKEWKTMLDAAWPTLSVKARTRFFVLLGWPGPRSIPLANADGSRLVDDTVESPEHLELRNIFAYPYSEEIMQNKLALLSAFKERLEKKQVHILLHHPPLPKPLVDKFRPLCVSVESHVTNLFKRPYLEELDTMAFPWSDIYDAPYHLRKRAGLERSRNLAEDIREATAENARRQLSPKNGF